MAVAKVVGRLYNRISGLVNACHRPVYQLLQLALVRQALAARLHTKFCNSHTPFTDFDRLAEHQMRPLTSFFLTMGVLGLLQGVVGCSPDQQRDYDYAYHMASQQPPYTGPIGAGLRLGMPQPQAARHLDSLRVAGALVWRLPFEDLPLQPYPDYLSGRLIGLQLVLVGDGLLSGSQCQALRDELQRMYGGPCYEHNPGREDITWTWFSGGTEISLTNVVGKRFELTYRDLYHAAAIEQEWMKTH